MVTEKVSMLQERMRKAIGEVEKRCGSGAIMALDGRAREAVEVIPTGSFALDRALGVGGIPRGRVIEIFGPESTGKTSLALSMVAQAQKMGGLCAFVDAEHALDLGYAEKLGVDTAHLMVSQPDYGEQALDVVDILVTEGGADLVVVDSVAALVPKAEIEGEMTDQQVGLQARLMSKALRKITAHCAKSRTTVVFINQIRMKIGVMFGNPETTTGGNALKFYASVRLEVRKVETITKTNEDDAIGNKVRVKVVKNKVAPPFRKVELDIMFGKGISASGSLLDAAMKYNIVEKSGSWYSYGAERIGQGRDNAKDYLETHPEVSAEMEKRLREVMFPPRTKKDATEGTAGIEEKVTGAKGPAKQPEKDDMKASKRNTQGDEKKPASGELLY